MELLNCEYAPNCKAYTWYLTNLPNGKNSKEADQGVIELKSILGRYSCKAIINSNKNNCTFDGCTHLVKLNLLSKLAEKK